MGTNGVMLGSTHGLFIPIRKPWFDSIRRKAILFFNQCSPSIFHRYKYVSFVKVIALNKLQDENKKDQNKAAAAEAKKEAEKQEKSQVHIYSARF